MNAQRAASGGLHIRQACENFGRLVIARRLRRALMPARSERRQSSRVFIGDMLQNSGAFLRRPFRERDAFIRRCGLHFLILLRVDFFKMRGGRL